MSEKHEAKSIDCVRQAEREWHDAVYTAHAHDAYPDAVEDFQRFYVRVHLTPFCEGGWSWWADSRKEALDAVGDVRGLRVLDYGCGFGGLGMYLSQRGAQVWGFDFSRPAIEKATAVAHRYGLPAQFDQMDAADLAYPDEFFDLVVGFGVLHHVIKYPPAGPQLLRVLKPGGRGVFHETLWDNALINLARRFTSVDAEAGDAPLTEREVRKFCQGFSQVRLEKRHLLYMLKRLAKLPRHGWYEELHPRHFWRRVKALDNQLLRIPGLRRYCGEVIVFLQK